VPLHPASGLDHARGKAEPAQPVQHVDAGEPCADDQCIERSIVPIAPAAVLLPIHAD
jgi:hypothetical protein